MRKNRFRVFGLLAIIGLFGLASCGGNSPQQESTQQQTTQQATSNTSQVSEQSASQPQASSAQAIIDPEVVITPENEVTETKLVTYNGPSLLKTSEKVRVKVCNKELFVFETLVNHGRVFSWIAPTTVTQVVNFSFEGKVHVEVEILEDVTIASSIVRPAAYAIETSNVGKKIGFDLTHPGNYVVEYNDDPTTAIHIFANPIETDLPDFNDTDLIYVGPGVYNANAFPIKDNTKIYLSGGAYVFGQFSCEDCKNVKIFGRGIISGSIYSRNSANEYKIPVVMRRVNNLVIKDVIFLDPAGWTLHLWKCDQVLVENVKIITARGNGDGISIQSCSNVEVKGGYVRCWDDALVVKNADLGSTAHIHIHDVVVWSDLAQCMEVGYETYGPTMDDIVFEDITVVHAFHKAVISIHNCDQAIITNVAYKNITVEDAQMLGDNRGDGENDFLIDFTIAYNQEWTKSGGARGAIKGVTIENVKVEKMAPTITSRILGDEEGTDVQDVTIKGVNIEGKQAGSAEELKIAMNDHVKNVTVSALEKAKGAHIHLPYKLALTSEEIESNAIPAIVQDGLLVPLFARYSGERPFIGVKSNVGITEKATHGAGSKTSTPADGLGQDFYAEGSSAEYACDNNDETLYISGQWDNVENEFAALTFDFADVTNVGSLRIVGDQTNKYSYSYSIQIWARRYKQDGTMNANYTRLLTTKEYEMSPASGNIIDINLPAQDFGGLQLRLARTDGSFAPKDYRIAEVEFYPPSLTFQKAIYDATEHNDVYPISKVVDGDPTGTSYYESKTLPAQFVIDLADVYRLSKLVLCLPPILTWTTRVQNIEIQTSSSNLAYNSSATEFVTSVPATDYTFDPTTGNRVIIDLNDVPCRFLKVIIRSNSASGGYGGQLSEVSAYGTK